MLSDLRRRNSALAIVLLTAAVALAAVLAYQAQIAARSHRRAAERALRDYASFAAFEFTQHARLQTLSTLMTAFVTQVARIDPENIAGTLPSVGEFAAEARQRDLYCRCLGGARVFFRYDWSSGAIVTTDGSMSPPVLKWVRDTVAAHTRKFPAPSLAPVPFGTVGEGRMRRLNVVVTNDSYVTLFGAPDGVPRVVAYVFSRDMQGNPVAAYGFEGDPGAFSAPIFAGIVRTEALLPPSLLQGVPNDSVLALSVTTADGRTLYRSRPLTAGAAADAADRFSATDTLDGSLGALVVRAALQPAYAEQMVVGGLPRSRLPVLLALFTITAGLMIVALLQLRRQQELARLRSDFVSGVSHELRTPLAQIRVFAELLHLGKLRSEAERTRSARIIDQEARRLAFLVENVLRFSLADREATRTAHEPLDLNREVTDAAEQFAPLAASRRTEIRIDVGPDVVVSADRGALRQILLNLLDNAVKYGPAGQTVRVGTAVHGERARVWVDDEGAGVDVADRARIWEPYRRLDRKLHASVGGSGIGLSVVRELADALGGRAWVESAEGGLGARFVIELPALPTMTADTQEMKVPTPLGGTPVMTIAAARAVGAGAPATGEGGKT